MSDLGLHCLPRSQSWDAMLIWIEVSGHLLKTKVYGMSVFFSNKCLCFACCHGIPRLYIFCDLYVFTCYVMSLG